MRIGVAEGDSTYQFYRVSGVIRLSDGTIVVADGSNTLRFFDAQGRFLRMVGGTGRGPGEFTRIGYLGAYAGDSVLVYDSGSRRITIFDRAGTVVRDWTPARRSALTVVGNLRDGAVMARDYVGHQGLRSGAVQDTFEILLFGPDGGMKASLGLIPGELRTQTVTTTGGMTQVRLGNKLFGRQLQFAAAGDRAFVSATDTLNIQVHDGMGTLRQILRSTAEPIPVTSQFMDHYHESMIRAFEASGQATPEGLTAMRRHQAEEQPAASLPAFAKLLATSDGQLWVQQLWKVWDGELPAWWVFGRDGQLAATVMPPPGLRIFEVDRDLVLGVERDSLGVEYVAGYTLQR